MKRSLAALAAAALVVLGVVVAPTAASAATGNVTGLITTTTLTGIDNAVLEFNQGGSTYYYYTDANGQIKDSTTLPVGSWTVFIHAAGYAPEFYNDSFAIAGATPVAVTNPGDPIVINAELSLGSTIEGTITGPGGTGVAGAQVFAFTSNDPDGITDVAHDITDANGDYSIGSLAPGTYQIWVTTDDSDDLVDEWYDNAYTRDTATPVQISTVNSTETVDVELDEGGTIAGTVVNTIGSPVDLPFIEAVSPLGGYAQSPPDPLGAYSLSGLLPDVYTVTATDFSDFFEDEVKTGVQVTAGSTSSANFVVTPALPDESEFTWAVAPISGPTSVEAGKTYTWKVDVSGDSDVYAILYSSPVFLGAATQDPDGTATITLTIPTNTPAGVHKLTFSSYDFEFYSTSRQYFDITVAAAKLPNMGVDITAPLTGGALLLLVGTGLWVAARRLRTVR